jgi:hypothetical protein
VKTDFLCDYKNLIHTLTDNQAHKMDGLLIVDSNGEIVEELKSSLLQDYAILKAKKEMRLKNRKAKLAPTAGPLPPPEELSATKKDTRLFKCEICGETKAENEFWTYISSEKRGKCNDCAKLVSDDFSNAEVPEAFKN